MIEIIKKLCKEMFEGLIPVAIGECETVRKKPAPDSVWMALEQLKSKKEDAYYIGDSEVDVETAHNAGLCCVGVTWGFRDRAVLEEKGAEIIIDRPEEILALL